MAQTVLHQFLDNTARILADKTAVEESTNGAITYGELAALSDQLRDRLQYLGVRPGDRVGIYMNKSIDAIAAIFGILKTGAAYVPVDPGAPAARNAFILMDCTVKAIVMERRFVEKLKAEIGDEREMPSLLPLDGTGSGECLRATLVREQERDPAPVGETIIPSQDSLAYILYTSGSTGKPKGVMLSHLNAVSYVDWCSDTFSPTQVDRFSSHAPFHFDLSILDIYVPIKHGATLILIGEALGKDPGRLANLISSKRISIWYSTPSILSLLIQYGKLEQYDYQALRIILFAGEVFPVKHLRALKNHLPEPEYYNLYGPTETNVCTFHKIPDHIPEERIQPFPIGAVCSHLQALVVDQDGQAVSTRTEGELCIAGDGVMQGYWNLPERTDKAFLTDELGRKWYKTGDVVVEEAGGIYTFIGRRDRMVKKRGYRVELGEIEAGLYRHPSIKEAAVVALSDEELGIRIKAFLSVHGEERPSIIQLKRFCNENLPSYMVPDLFSFQSALPKTSTDKIDYQRLKEIR